MPIFQPQFKAWLQLLKRPTPIAILGTVLLLELLLRLLVPTNQHPVGSYHTPELRTKVMQHRSEKPFDVLLAGSSVAAVNYNPEQIQRVAAAQEHQISVFNAGIRGCNFICITPALTQLFLADSKPHLLIILVSPGDLSERHRFRIRQSKTYLDAISVSPVKRRLQNLASSSLWIYGFREELVTLARTGKWQYEDLVEQRGYVNMGSKPRKWRSPVLHFDMNGPSSLALVELIRYASNKSIDVMLLPSLGSPEQRTQITSAEQQAFNDLLHKVSVEEGVQLLDELTPLSPNTYIDGVHLDTASALRQSTALAEKLLIINAL